MRLPTGFQMSSSLIVLAASLLSPNVAFAQTDEPVAEDSRGAIFVTTADPSTKPGGSVWAPPMTRGVAAGVKF